MPRVFRANPNSLVQIAIETAGGIKALATQLHLTEQTVAAWAKTTAYQIAT